jgi:hypothetical protein
MKRIDHIETLQWLMFERNLNVEKVDLNYFQTRNLISTLCAYHILFKSHPHFKEI